MRRSKSEHYEYQFRITGAYTPASLPMGRLAEYLAQLSLLFGEKELVHFRGVRRGSALVAVRVEAPAVPKVRERVRRASLPDAPIEIRRPIRALDELLRGDNAEGELQENNDTLVRFGGRTSPEKIGPIIQEGELVGVLVRIGGTSVPAHATIAGAEQTFNCELTPQLARNLAEHLYGSQLRLTGTAWWYRSPDGTWEQARFRINDFFLLPGESLAESVQRLRQVPGGEWSAFEDPWTELAQLRAPEDATE